MIEENSRPYITVFGSVYNFQNANYHIVIKNFGQSASTILGFCTDYDIATLSLSQDHDPFSNVVGLTLAPGQSLSCPIDVKKLPKDIGGIGFTIHYSWGRKNYHEKNYLKITSNFNIPYTRASSEGKELKIISYALQEIAERLPYAISKHLASVMDIKLSKLRPSHVQGIINDLDGHRRTQEKVLLTIKQILNQAVINDFIYKNVAIGVSLPPKQKTQKRALTTKEQKEIFGLKLPALTRSYLSIILYCGLRRGEAWALTKKDVNFKENTISVDKTVSLEGGLKVGPPKTTASIRTIPMPDTLVKILKPYLKQQPGMFVFGDSSGIMSDRDFRKMWDDFISLYNKSKGGSKDIRAIADDITPHIFRHTYATMLYQAGVDLKSAQYLLGHATIAMTLDIYTHLDKLNNVDMSKKLNAFLKQDLVKI
ncbi:site-specific integrase [Christensenellaceae bacterium OttesenSCG-928-K19]|nr:site-specific integrase [Christensenellaceae bacterium OttesenSCG-928-K19]